LYQPRFFPSAPAVIYIHGWGGHRLMGEDNLAYYISAAGYTVLSYSARGFGNGESGGRVTLAGPNEINDLKNVIDWLLNDPDNVIGPRVTKIGVVGGSYGGGHSFQISSDPRVSAVVPIIGWTDLEQALFPNGAVNYRLGIGEFYGGINRGVGTPPFYNYDRIEFEMFDAAAEGRSPDSSIRQELGARSIAEQDESGREVLKPARQPRVPTFIIQSWDDYLFPSTQVLDVFSQLAVPKQLYMGRQGHPPGGHEYDGEELYIGAAVLRWFNHYLLDVGGADSKNISSAAAPSTLAPSKYKEFPSADAESLSLYFKEGGSLSRKRKGKNRAESAGGVFHPQRIRSSRLGAEIPTKEDMFSATTEQAGTLPRSLVYTYPAWESDAELMGPGEFTMFVSSSTSRSVDLVVRMFDVAPDGGETEVTVGIIRVTGLRPDEIKRVTFRDFGDHWIFRRGHSLRLKVTNIDFPDFRPPGENDNLISEFTLHSGKASPSSVKLAIRDR
ncbi:MAG TPA: alpha/beta fold hydrolase, partial [Blastocatellia bacterium]|nr:alpha/beta fold hydrolase [Blastocatellia bacterium]